MAALGAALLSLVSCGGGGNSSSPTPQPTSATAAAKFAPPAGKTWMDVVEKTELGYRQGNPNAPVRLVEYGSRTCPVCGHFANTGIEPLRAKYVSTGQVSYEYREFWVHPQDPGPSLLGNCVPTEAFFTVLDQMYAEQTELNKNAETVYPTVQPLPEDQKPTAWAERLGYLDFMKQRGLPEAKARQCLNDKALLKTITDRMEKAHNEKDISGTPTFFINDVQAPQQPPTVSWEQLEPLLQAAGAR
jgi:protein-disulfide isomerase